MTLATLWPLVLRASAYGVLLSAVVFPLILAITKLNPEILLKDYPPDIQAKHGPMSARARRQRGPVAVVVIVLMVALITLSLRGLRASAGGDLAFPATWVHLFSLFAVFNLLDWLVLDWLIVVRLRPAFMILPGTEGLAGYGDYGFHFRGFLMGMVITLVTSLVVAGVVAAFW